MGVVGEPIIPQQPVWEDPSGLYGAITGFSGIPNRLLFWVLLFLDPYVRYWHKKPFEIANKAIILHTFWGPGSTCVRKGQLRDTIGLRLGLKTGI